MSVVITLILKLTAGVLIAYGASKFLIHSVKAFLIYKTAHDVCMANSIHLNTSLDCL